MILSDRDIRRSMQESGGIRIDNMHPDAIGPSSVDLRLQNEFIRYKTSNDPIDPSIGVDGCDTFWAPSVILSPNEFILGATVERIYVPTNMAARIEGKSSLGRLGISVHETAGYLDAGVELNVTLEIKNNNHARPIILRAGMWIAQVTFELLSSECEVPYNVRKGSRYYGDSGPVASRIHLNAGSIGETK